MAKSVLHAFHMKNRILFCFAMIAAAPVASAQDKLVSFGALGGVPFLNQNQGGDESRRYIVGPSVEFRLPAGFAIEVDALYRRIGNSSMFDILGGAMLINLPAVTSEVNRQRGNYWQFPVLGKYYFRPRSAAWRPFIATGWSLRTVAFHEDVSAIILEGSGIANATATSFHSRTDVGAGAVFAAGARFRAGKFAFTPQVRYTYWGSTQQFDLRRNEAGVLLGISF
jgi:hypothetical protein